MRLWTSLPISLLALLSFHTAPSTQSTTLVDALSADPDYTSVLKLLQRARLIPTFNRLNGSTFFAPTNDAIKRHQSRNSLRDPDSRLWDIESVADDAFDNVHEQLRQQLFYHLINYTIPPLLDDNQIPLVLKTLHYPHHVLQPPSNEPPPSPPWMPIPNSTLGGQPQRLRVAARDSDVFVGVDAFGSGGATVIKGQVDAGNGILLGIDDVLEPPVDLADVIAQQPSLSYFNRVLTEEVSQALNSTSGLTLFLPVNDAWSELDDLERLYLESPYASDDLHRILSMHVVAQDSIRYSESFEPAVNLTTVGGNTLEIISNHTGKTHVSSAELVQPDIYAANGVLHLVSSLLLPPGTLRLTPEKYLLALNCTNFVSLLHSADLSSMINDTDAKWTILAPRDDVLNVLGNADLPEKGSEELKKLLQYHFLPGHWTLKKLKDGMLLETALREDGLNGGAQVLSVEAGPDGSTNAQSIRFGGASTIGDVVEINNTLVYFISRPLTPPEDALQEALPRLDLSSFIAAVFSTTLGEILKTAPRTSILIPHNAAFKRLGMLVSAHLLAVSSKKDLEHVIMHHTLDSVQYTNELLSGGQHTFATLEGSDLQLERAENGSLYLRSSGGWAGMQSALYPQNLLTRTGVVHELSDILIPRSVELTVGKLVRAAQGTTMATMMAKSGFEWVLNGTAPPADSPWAERGLDSAGWTLLCPTDDAFKGMNLTALYNDVGKLREIVSQHLIPTPKSVADVFSLLASRIVDDDVLNNNRPLLLTDSATYTTLRSASSAYGDVVVRQADSGKAEFVIGIKNARGTTGEDDWAHVIAWGRSSSDRHGMGGVIQIDRLLMPYEPPWMYEYGAPALVGVSGIALILLFFWGVRWVWSLDTTEATYEPVGGFGRDDVE
ncbi:FAS1 domain-containing protein [Fistulina hepatica ATCC 64428]|uniref:FAS1 domain-containing protein n=1 Tax=Fistulina hepatica ATCC 64428 TaxID=1128425 RepID=A0A0D7A409_9AGAR|nr:FAS1 domain-containing protein [Fistulina hepatica ATCC 64428]